MYCIWSLSFPPAASPLNVTASETEGANLDPSVANGPAADAPEPDMTLESFKRSIKDYLGSCSSNCDVNLQVAKQMLERHQKYAKGDIGATLFPSSGDKFRFVDLNGNYSNIRVDYYVGSSVQYDYIDIDFSEVVAIYSAALEEYGAEVLENWGRAPKPGTQALKARVVAYLRLKANEHIRKISPDQANEWKNF